MAKLVSKNMHLKTYATTDTKKQPIGIQVLFWKQLSLRNLEEKNYNNLRIMERTATVVDVMIDLITFT